MSRAIRKPPLSTAALREIISQASHTEKHLNLGDETRKSAMKFLDAWASAIPEVYPEATGLWFNISKRKVFGRYLVVWGIGEQPTLPE